MNKHLEKAQAYRNADPMTSNCAQTILKAYADELGMTEELANTLSDNFGGGMKCGGTCGAITAALMVLGAKGVSSPAQLNAFRKAVTEKHNSLTSCVDLLTLSKERGIGKKAHCDSMIYDAIAAIDEICAK